MKIIENYSLKKENTFHLDVKARYFVEVESIDDLRNVIRNELFAKKKILVLGHGANVLFTKDFDGVVIKDSIKGIKIIKEDESSILLEIGGGENWENFVTYTVDHNWGGVENLAFIPGTVGAAPVQNIAAYGQNISEVLDSLVAIDLSNGQEKSFNKEECDFKYRDSFFKSTARDKYFVVSVRLVLSKNPIINTSYFETGKTYKTKGSLEDELATIAKPPYTVKNVSDAVTNIRKKKLPNVSELGTAGSFFKNPIITRQKYLGLLKTDPDLQCYPVDKLTYPKLDDASLTHEDYVKVPGGRLLDNLGWKGKRIGNVGTYPYQAMAIVNYGNATPQEIISFYKSMQEDVYNKYQIKLEPEVNII